ncbi:MAG: hypothetical protein JSV96_10850 [Candidatus Aminicenantes bacterium]|nr:MAG: hypothetical protein JSV96_10850 [Candidatus Aminicenantes bacterium]
MKANRIVTVLLKEALIAFIVGFSLTFKQFIVSSDVIISEGYLKHKMYKLIALSYLEAFKQWIILTILNLFVLLIITLLVFAVWKLILSKMVKIRIRDKNKIRIILISFFCFIFFLFYGWVINHFFLPHRFSFISLVGNAMILIFTIFLGWSLIRRLRKEIIFVGVALFFISISLLPHFRLQTYQGEKTLSIKTLRSLPYASWTPIRYNKFGVTRYIHSSSCKGINVYSSENIPRAYLLDMNGRILHTFFDKTKKKNYWQSGWKLIKPYQNNDFLVLIENYAIMMIDWDSNIKWIKKKRFHHDFVVAENGDIYAIMNKKSYSPWFSLFESIRDNCFVILTKDGEIKAETSLAKIVFHNKTLFDASKNQKKRYSYGRDAWDIFHTNTIEVINRDMFFGNKKLFKKGDVLFCVRNLNIIGVMDLEKEKIIWSWGMNELELPHHPSLLENGNILIFDNGTLRKYSRVIELNLITEKIEWEYKSISAKSFFSAYKGSAQRFSNGNTLITESEKGHVFEVTNDGKVVWEFYNPEIDKKKNKRATIYRMMRITSPDKYSWFKALE